MTASTEYLWDVFVSHNGKQKPWVREFVSHLESLGMQVFFDEVTIEFGEDITQRLEEGLHKSRHIVVVISPDAMTSRWMALEIATAIYLDPSADARRLIPVLLEYTSNPEVSVLVSRLKYVDLVNADQRSRNYRLLLSTLAGKKVVGVDAPEWRDEDTTQRDDIVEAVDNIVGDEAWPDAEPTTIQISINLEWFDFDENARERLRHALSSFLGVPLRQIRISTRPATE
jgi:hypothetical protein